jgi:hypothetical protein
VVSSGLQGARGATFAFNGTDSSMKMEGTDLLLSSGSPNGGVYTAGPLQVTGSASKVSFDLINVRLMEASQNVLVALNGAESKLGINGLSSQTGSQRVSLSALGNTSEVKVEKVLLRGNPEVVIESGPQGSTTVSGSPNTINASQLIRVRAGLGGSCSASPQGLSAPTVQVCQ